MACFVKPGKDFVKVKARFGQVGDQVGQGQGQELDNSPARIQALENIFMSLLYPDQSG